MSSCPDVDFNFKQREDGGPGNVPVGRVGSPYFACYPTCERYVFQASSGLLVDGVPEQITYTADGQLPPGLTLHSDGSLAGAKVNGVVQDGIPTQTGLFTFTVTAHGVVSGATKTMFITVLINAE